MESTGRLFPTGGTRLHKIVLLALYSYSLIVTSEALTTFGRQAAQPVRTSVINRNSDGENKPNSNRRVVMADAFLNAGKHAGLEIWRIENFEPKPYSTKDYGKFYSGDSYIVLSTKERKGTLIWDIHFWLGKETSQDEAGSAAIYSVQLDDQLGGAATQHREVQDHESQLFLSYFKSGIRYLSGGVASGFTHVDRNSFEKRLFQVKGKRNVRVKQVPITIASMNEGDCFILDSGRDVYVYTGKSAKRAEKLKAISAANQIRDQDHGGRARVHIIDDTSSEAEVQTFFTVLGEGSPDKVPDESAGGDDSESDNEEQHVYLHKVSDSSGSIKLTEIAQKPLRQNMLDSNDCFILDTGDSNIFVWTGRNCKKSVKDQAMSKAEEYLKSKKYPAWTRVQRVVQGAEPAIFRQYFFSWQGHGELHPRLVRSIGGEPVTKLEDKSEGEAPEYMPDNGDGTKEVFRVEDSDLEAVQSDVEGKLFGGDSYVIKYQTVSGEWLVYIWQGANSPSSTKYAAFLKALEIGNELDGKVIIIRVVQNYEPKHFLHIFGGKLVTFLGGHASGFKNIKDHETFNEGETRMYRIRGTCTANGRADQVEAAASSLESDDVFLVENGNNTWLWFGKDSDEIERDVAQGFVEILAPESTASEVEENSEPEDFWDAIGGKGTPKSSYSDDLNVPDESRLFHVHVKHGKVKIEEIYDFTQEDLEEDDVMILESPTEVFVWIGKDSSEEERRIMGKQLKTLEKHNRQNSVLFFINQGQEPSNFISQFPTWDANLWETTSSNYMNVKSRIQAYNAAISSDED